MNYLFDEVMLVNKPVSWTSFDVVARLRAAATGAVVQRRDRDPDFTRRVALPVEGRLPRLRVGHSGTLDPAAEGLLIVAVGNGTKKIPELTKLDKVYQVTMQLGVSSTTGDREGQLTEDPEFERHTLPSIDDELVQKALAGFVGEITQYPPAFSAVKIDGRRAYELAREGKKVETKPRKVHIYSISNVEVELPAVRFTCHVGSGTYIRTLVEDVASALNTSGYMSALRRTAVGEFSLEGALQVDEAVEALKKAVEEL